MLALFGFSLTVDASTLMTGVGFGAGAVGALAALFGLYRLARASSNLPKRAVVEATGWLLMSASVAVAFVGVAAWYQAVPDNKGYLPLEAAREIQRLRAALQVKEMSMNESEQRDLVQAVERQIAFLLADLEKRTGCYVEALSIHSIEVTKVSSVAPEYLRRVEVDLRRQPGSQWQTQI